MNDSQVFEFARERAKQEKFDEALALLHKLSPTFSWGREELLFKARLIQLSREEFEKGWDFEDVERCLHAALALESENVDVLLELGFFHARVMDDCEKGMTFFTAALKRVDKQYTEVLRGIIECLTEQESETAAFRFVDQTLESLKSTVKDSIGFM